jgi:hypothetical protein
LFYLKTVNGKASFKFFAYLFSQLLFNHQKIWLSFVHLHAFIKVTLIKSSGVFWQVCSLRSSASLFGFSVSFISST